MRLHQKNQMPRGLEFLVKVSEGVSCSNTPGRSDLSLHLPLRERMKNPPRRVVSTRGSIRIGVRSAPWRRSIRFFPCSHRWAVG